MNKLSKIRHLMIAIIGILALVASLWNSGRVLAAQNRADVSVIMVADKKRVKIGEYIVYTVTATNHGPNTALSVVVSHGLADQLNFVSLACDRGVSASSAFCEYPMLGPGESVVSIFVATPNPSVRKRERNSLTATATVAFQMADTVDPDPGNNWASNTVKLIGKLTH
jgi:uncharacterized repeat protein (TIGR01451 family)